MSLPENLLQIKMNGFCIVEGIVPDKEVGAIRDSLVEAQARFDAESEARKAEIRSRGHRIGSKGVGSLSQVINETQTFAPYLADRRILDIAEAIFGPFVRISSTGCVINRPGTPRGYWHADWPYNQTNAAHVRAPYPDATMHLSTIWMFTEFSAGNGATHLLPGSHRMNNNPSVGGVPDFDPDAPYPTEVQAVGTAGSVLVYDSRLWHAIASNDSDRPRVAILVRYAPWWLNLNPTMIGLPDHTAMVVETGGKNYESPPVRREVFESLPEDVKPLYRHWVK